MTTTAPRPCPPCEQDVANGADPDTVRHRECSKALTKET